MRPLAMRVGAIFGLCLALSACLGPFAYEPIGPEMPYGYRDTQNADGGYTILVIMPEYETDISKAQTFWDRRAGELCSGAYRKIMFRAERATVYYDNYGARPGAYFLEGYAYCENAQTPAADTAPAEPQAAPVQQ